MQDFELTTIKNLVANGEIDKALEALLSYTIDNQSTFQNDITSLKGQYSQWQKEKRIGLEPEPKELRRIELAVLEFVDKINTPKVNQIKSNIISKIINGSKKFFLDLIRFLFRLSLIIGIPIVIILLIKFIYFQPEDFEISYFSETLKFKEMEHGLEVKDVIEFYPIEDLKEKLESFSFDYKEGDEVLQLTLVSKQFGIRKKFSIPDTISISELKNKIISHFELNGAIGFNHNSNTIYYSRGYDWYLRLNEQNLPSNLEHLYLKYLNFMDIKNGDVIRLGIRLYDDFPIENFDPEKYKK